MRKALAALACQMLVAALASGQAGLLVPTATGKPDPAILSLRHMSIDIGIARGYARVNVRQIFENHTSDVQEGTYRFKLPPSAAVGDFAVWDGLVRIPGVILEKRRARSIYRELTTQRVDPGLLQQGEEEDREEGIEGARRPSGGTLFSVTVSPIPPHATKRLEIAFQQEVPTIDGRAELRLPLAPIEGDPPVARELSVRVEAAGAEPESPREGALPLTRNGGGLAFSGQSVRLDRDLVVLMRPSESTPLRLSAFRNPEGALPDTVSLAPWERASDIPPEKDGFFLLELLAPPRGVAPSEVPAPSEGFLDLAILFDTSLSHRFAGLEASYAHAVEALGLLRPGDRFVLVSFDASPAVPPGGLSEVSPAAIDAALRFLRERPLSPGNDVSAAVEAASALLTDGRGRILLLTDGQVSNRERLSSAKGSAELFTIVTGDEVDPALAAASTQLLPSGSTSLEGSLFMRRLLARNERASPAREDPIVPFTARGGDPGLRDIYPILVQPIEPGSLSGWVGRYAAPQASLLWELSSFRLPEPLSLQAGLPDKALDARDLPRRWARARVDALLRRIEMEGERREWVEEIIDLSRRYKFVTPYTAFLAAPRALLRPRRIQPGDPVLRVECDPGTTSAVALFPFGLRLPLTRRPDTNLWEGRFLVPESFPDGRYPVRIVLRDARGAQASVTRHFILDGTAPKVLPDPLPPLRAGSEIPIRVRADEDVIALTAHLGEAAAVPLRWDPRQRACTGLLRVPGGISGRQEIFIEAVDAANNHGFARLPVEVLP